MELPVDRERGEELPPARVVRPQGDEVGAAQVVEGPDEVPLHPVDPLKLLYGFPGQPSLRLRPGVPARISTREAEADRSGGMESPPSKGSTRSIPFALKPWPPSATQWSTSARIPSAVFSGSHPPPSTFRSMAPN
jgi:hypothetical protein